MCRVSSVFRRTLGIDEYRPGTIKPALVRRPARFGARGRMNGYVVLGGFGADDDVITQLVTQHRIIRQMVADADRRRGRGRDA